MSHRIIRRSSSLKAPKIFVLQLNKKTALAKYVRKMGFHTDPSKERPAKRKSSVMTLLKKQKLQLAIGDASKRSKGPRLKGVS